MVTHTTQNTKQDDLKDKLIQALEQSLSAASLTDVLTLLKKKDKNGKPWITIPSTDESVENLARLMVLLAEPRSELLIDHPKNKAIRELCEKLIAQLKKADLRKSRTQSRTRQSGSL